MGDQPVDRRRGAEGAGQRAGRARAPAGTHLARVATVRKVLEHSHTRCEQVYTWSSEDRRVQAVAFTWPWWQFSMTMGFPVSLKSDA